MATRDAVFVTGATGLVGAGVLRQALRDNSSLDAFVLVRTPGRWPALEASLGPLAARVTPVAGDVCADGLGLSSEDRAILARRVTAVVHSAGDIVFTRPLEESRRTNVGGTRHLLELADGWPGLRRLVHVSTAYVAGRRTGTVLEADNGVDAGWINGYEQAKYEAEALVRDCGCSWAIARPSTVVCDAVDGPVSQDNSVHHTLRLWRDALVPMMPGTYQTPVDVVTLDEVVRAVADLLDGHDNGMVHLCAGARAMTVGDIVALAWEIWERDPAWRRRAIPRPAFADLETYRLFEATVGETADRRLQRIMRGLGSYAPQLAYPKRFDTHHADRLVGHCPPPAAEIWRTVLERTAADGRSAREVAA